MFEEIVIVYLFIAIYMASFLLVYAHNKNLNLEIMENKEGLFKRIFKFLFSKTVLMIVFFVLFLYVVVWHFVMGKDWLF